MLHTIVKKCSNFDDDDENEVDPKVKDRLMDEATAEGNRKARNVIKSKIKSVASMSKMFSTLREEQEMILKIKNISPDGKLPRGILLDGKPAIKHAAKQFNIA